MQLAARSISRARGVSDISKVDCDTISRGKKSAGLNKKRTPNVQSLMEEFISKAATLLEALPYIQRFRSQIFVVKYGGSFMDSPDPEERHRVARDVVFLEAVGINPVVVHGGVTAITRALETAGVKSGFVQGYRV